MMEQQDMGNEKRPIGDTYSPPGDDEISFIELVNVVLKNRRMVVLTPFIIFVFVVGFTIIKSRTYSASTSFIPQSSSSQRSLTTNLAAQFGISIPAGEAGQTPAFYANLIISREILKDLADNTYVYHDDEETVQASLPKLWKIKEESEELVREKMIQVLEELISVNTDRETDLVTLTVQTKWAEVSQGIAQDILDLVNQFNLSTRQKQATAEREFIESRLEEVKKELRESEDALQDFLQKNRQWQESPDLEFIHDRLYREVTMRQQIFTTLNQAYEQARIDEVRDTPVITVVEKPEAPILPDRRRLLFKGILALIVGGMFGIFGAFGREFMVRGRQQEADQFAEFEILKRESLQELRHPWRLFRK